MAENAARHAWARVAIVVSGDGPCIPEAQLTAMRRRGARLDTSLPGDGLGLAIATEIVEAAGGALALADSAPGLEAAVLLPAAPKPKADTAS